MDDTHESGREIVIPTENSLRNLLGEPSRFLDMSTSRGDGGSNAASEPAGSDTSMDVTPPTVLIADGERRAERYGQWLEEPFPIRRARSKEAARDLTDQSVGVAVLGAGVTDEAKEELLKVLNVRCPFARTVIVQGDDQPPMLEGPGYDVCMFTPVEEADLREAVVRLARIATYERAVAAFFEYTTYAANIEVRKDREALEDDEDYRELQERIDRTKATLGRIRSTMDETDRRVLMESLEGDPAASIEERQGTVAGSRHPDNCSDCKLEWGPSHGNGLGQGYDQLGAFVWKCTRCGNVQQAASASHRWLARR